MRVKFKRPDTDSYVWVEMTLPKVTWVSNRQADYIRYLEGWVL